MLVASNINRLEEVFENLKFDPPLIIGVEGASTAGKSHLAEQLARVPDTLVISTDNFHDDLVGDRYQDRLRASEIGVVVEHAYPPYQRVVVEGICLRDTFALLGFEPHVYVYCKRLSPYGVWNHDPEYDEAASGSEFQQGVVDWWSLDYHRRARPHEKADVTWEWRDAP